MASQGIIPLQAQDFNSGSLLPQMFQRAQDRVQDHIQPQADIFCQKTQHKAAVLLQQKILAPVAAVGVQAGQMLWAVEFDRQSRVFAEQIDFHPSAAR